MHKAAREELDVRFKIVVLDLAEQFSVTKTCRDFNILCSTFYRWKKPIAYNHPRKIHPEVAAKILEIR